MWYIIHQTQKLKILQKEKPDNFVSVFASNSINRFINFHNTIKEKNTTYPFVIMNTDRSDKKGTHWWRILDLNLKKKCLFGSFGFKGLYYTK